MHVVAEGFSLAKAGNAPRENEDAFWPSNLSVDAPTVRVAVGDGATESSFSSIWAKQLVRAFRKGQFDNPSAFMAHLPDLQKRWWEIAQRKPLPWYAQQKVTQGSFATLLGLALNEKNQWKALAVGDSCLFHLRGQELLRSFPLAAASAFTNSPHLVATDVKQNHRVAERAAWAEGDWMAGDTFYLLTDALACWLMAQVEMEQDPWAVLCELNAEDTPSSFERWVSELRTANQIRNDDVTVLRVMLL